MSAYCICNDCKVRDMKTGQTPWCFGDVDRGSATDAISTLLEYVQEIGGEANFKIQNYVAHRRQKLGLPADPRQEWREHLERQLTSGNLSPRQVDTAQELLSLI
jgi:hypothetical protein